MPHHALFLWSSCVPCATPVIFAMTASTAARGGAAVPRLGWHPVVGVPRSSGHFPARASLLGWGGRLRGIPLSSRSQPLALVCP